MLISKRSIEEAMDENVLFEKIFIQLGLRGEWEKRLRKYAGVRSIPYVQVPKEKLEKLSKKHQGVVVLAQLVEYASLENIINEVFAQGKNPFLLMLDRISDVRNFGALARSALILGVDAIIIGSKNQAVINADAVKTSAGALLKIAVCRTHSLVSTLDFLHQLGISSMATDLSTKDYIYDLDLTEPLVIILGEEHQGIHPKLISMAHHRVKIPQIGDLDSLNVSVAGGIVCYEIMKQRLNQIN